MKTTKTTNGESIVYLVGSHFAVMRYMGAWDARRVSLSGSPYGELLNRFKTMRAAVEYVRAVAKNEGKDK